MIAFLRAHTKLSSSVDTVLLKTLKEKLQPRTFDDDDDALAAANTAEASLAALYSLLVAEEAIEDPILLSIVAYTEAGQLWTTKAAAYTAELLLDKYISDDAKRQEFIVTNVLQRYLRPAFSKSTASVTAEGRPVLFRDPVPEGGFHTKKVSWKDAGPHIITIFSWSVQGSKVLIFIETP